MVGDWIKMCFNFWDDFRVLCLCDLIDQGEVIVIGGLYWFWVVVDQYIEIGVMIGFFFC